MQRNIGKSVLKVVKHDLLDAVGTSQLCAGQEAGREAVFHAMEQIFADEDTEVLLLVDASNAFNCLNSQATLFLTVERSFLLCHIHILITTYRSNSQLFC